MENKETKVIPIEGAINIEKYYEAYPDGNGYIFNGYLHGDLLAECIKANYTLLEKQEECERLKNELLTYGATGICETCTEKSVLENDKLKSTIRCLEKDLSTTDCITETLKAQYKELQAENDSLKSELMQTNCYLDVDKEIIDKLKADNEELKEYIKHLHNLCGNETDKQYGYKQTLTEIKEIAEPYQKDIQNICSNCNNYDDCHACCKFDLNCYQYKKGDTKACGKFIELKEFEINNLANKILNKISEVIPNEN